jgi:gluconolactonase
MNAIELRRGAVVLCAACSLLTVVASAEDQTRQAYPTIGTIVRNDPRFDQIVPRNAVIERLDDGFTWSEGPVWVPKGGYLLFSDVPQNTVFLWREGRKATSYLKPSGDTSPVARKGVLGSNGLALDERGRLVLCQHGDRRIARLESDNRFTTLADRYQGKRLNSPNDLIFRSNGDLYFTDPPFGLPGLNDDPAKELDFNGVFRLGRDGTLTVLTKEISLPNGIALAPDEKTLYVANSDSDRPVWMAFEVKGDGDLGAGKVFYDASGWIKGGKKGVPDGLKVDRAGNLFASGPGGINVFAPDGTPLGRIDTGQPTANCGWGEDGSVLYITSNMYLCRIKLATRGLGF